jgi:pimeloyl-ACP methyl ester carboxylesterase
MSTVFRTLLLTRIMFTTAKSCAPHVLKAHSSPVDRIGALVEGRGTSVVLLHSSMSSKHQWRKLIDCMRDRHRLIAIDLHGYGETSQPWSVDCFALNDEVLLVESVLTSVLQSDERFHLVGHSYGGVVALQLAQKHPQRVRSLSLFEPIPFHLFTNCDAAMAEVNSMRRQLEASLGTDDGRSGAACFIDYWSGGGAFSRMPEDRQALMGKLLPKTVVEFQSVARERLRGDAYQRIVAPTCLISGSSSPSLAHTATSILAGLLPTARHHQIPAGHMAPLTDPSLVNPIIERFIRHVDGALANEHEERSSDSKGPQVVTF